MDELTLIYFNGELVHAKHYDEAMGWAEIPYVVERNGVPHCPLNIDGGPITIIVEGEVNEMGDAIDSDSLIIWMTIAFITTAVILLVQLTLMHGEGKL